MAATAIIEDFSFYVMALTKVEIPVSVTTIEYQAFEYSGKGASVVIHSLKGAITYVVDWNDTTSTTPGYSTFTDSNSSLTPTYVTD